MFKDRFVTTFIDKRSLLSMPQYVLKFGTSFVGKRFFQPQNRVSVIFVLNRYNWQNIFKWVLQNSKICLKIDFVQYLYAKDLFTKMCFTINAK